MVRVILKKMGLLPQEIALQITPAERNAKSI